MFPAAAALALAALAPGCAVAEAAPSGPPPVRVACFAIMRWSEDRPVPTRALCALPDPADLAAGPVEDWRGRKWRRVGRERAT